MLYKSRSCTVEQSIDLYSGTKYRSVQWNKV